MSRFFIDRPIFAVVVSIFIVLAGLAAIRVLPIAQYPEIAPPVVTVRAVYPGASAQVIEQTVAAPLENQITGIENMLYMSSTSTSNGVLEIQVTFDIGTTERPRVRGICTFTSASTTLALLAAASAARQASALPV